MLAEPTLCMRKAQQKAPIAVAMNLQSMEQLCEGDSDACANLALGRSIRSLAIHCLA